LFSELTNRIEEIRLFKISLLSTFKREKDSQYYLTTGKKKGSRAPNAEVDTGSRYQWFAAISQSDRNAIVQRL
jgi:hypothetical protein